MLEQAGFDAADTELLLDREIQASGKSRVYVNNRPASVALLKDLAPHLGDIHGQHDQQLLFEAAAQLAMLDSFAQTGAQRGKVRELYAAWKRVSGEIAELENADQEKLRMLDLWQFQRNEIEGAGLRSGEDVELEAERRVQQNAGRLLETRRGCVRCSVRIARIRVVGREKRGAGSWTIWRRSTNRWARCGSRWSRR